MKRKLGVAEWRKILGETQTEVAEKMGIHPNTWREYEKNPATMRIGTLLKFCSIYGIKINDIRLFDANVE